MILRGMEMCVVPRSRRERERAEEKKRRRERGAGERRGERERRLIAVFGEPCTFPSLPFLSLPLVPFPEPFPRFFFPGQIAPPRLAGWLCPSLPEPIVRMRTRCARAFVRELSCELSPICPLGRPIVKFTVVGWMIGFHSS